jgi:GNAT superfamily N-acetyltransferase
MKFVLTTYEEIKPMIQKNIEENRVIVDSFWEQHVIESNHYAIQDGAATVGYFSIHKEKTLVGFYLQELHLQHGRALFEQIKRYEQVTNAMVATGDEIFLSHCADNYAKLEKQAFFSVYRKEAPVGFQRIPLTFKRLTNQADLELLKLAGSFFAEEPLDKLFDAGFHYRIYVVYDQEELVGFGVVETGRVLRGIASVGMYVMEKKRRLGYAKNILRQLCELMSEEGYNCRSGCWYYNHNSLKSMEAAGAYSKTRLLRFYF